MHTLISSSVFIAEIVMVFGAVAVSLVIEKRCLCAPRILFILQQAFMLLYIIFFLNPFKVERESDEEIGRLLCVFELFASFFIVLIYLWMLHSTASASASAAHADSPLLSLSLFSVSTLFFLVTVFVFEWTLVDPRLALASKLFSWQLNQSILLLVCVCCAIRITIRNDVERLKPLRSYVPFYIFTYVTVVLFLIAPRFAYMLVLIVGGGASASVTWILKASLFLTPFYNFLFVLLINCQTRECRETMWKAIERSIRGMKTGPLPHISVQEPSTTTSTGAPPQRAHIALNLMRNPLNSFTKLQRQTAPPPATTNLLVLPKEQRRYLAPSEPPEEPGLDEPGFRTVVMLSRASEISRRFQSIRESAQHSPPPRLQVEGEVREEEDVTHDGATSSSTSNIAPPTPPPCEKPLDVSALFFVTTAPSSLFPIKTKEHAEQEASPPPKREKRAIERIREMLQKRRLAEQIQN